MGNQSQWNAWKSSGNHTAMTYSIGEGFTPEQEDAIHQTFRKLQKLTGTPFKATQHHDLFTRREIESHPWLRRELQGYLKDSDTGLHPFHLHDDRMPHMHSDLYITTEIPERNKDAFGSAFVADANDVIGKNSLLISMNAGLFLNGNNEGVEGFTKNFYHELGHAVAGFAHTSFSGKEQDDIGVENFFNAMENVHLDVDTGMSEMEFAGNEYSGNSGMRPRRSVEGPAKEADASSLDPNKETEIIHPRVPAPKGFTYKIHGEGCYGADARVLKSLPGRDFRKTHDGEPADINIVYFNKRRCPKTPSIPHIVHSTELDMNGDGLSDVVQFDRNGGYRVSLRRTNGTLAPRRAC